MPDMDPANLRLAPASAYWDDVHLGYVSFRTPITIEDDSKEVELMAGQEGDSPVDSVLTGHRCTVTVPLAEVTAEKLAIAIPNAVIAGSTVTIKNRAGQRQRALAKELRIVLIIEGDESTDPGDIFVFPEASPKAGVITQSFGQEQQELAVKFTVWPDPTTKVFYSVG